MYPGENVNSRFGHHTEIWHTLIVRAAVPLYLNDVIIFARLGDTGVQ